MKTKEIPLTGGVILIIDLHDWDLMMRGTFT